MHVISVNPRPSTIQVSAPSLCQGPRMERLRKLKQRGNLWRVRLDSLKRARACWHALGLSIWWGIPSTKSEPYIQFWGKRCMQVLWQTPSVVSLYLIAFVGTCFALLCLAGFPKHSPVESLGSVDFELRLFLAINISNKYSKSHWLGDNIDLHRFADAIHCHGLDWWFGSSSSYPAMPQGEVLY